MTEWNLTQVHELFSRLTIFQENRQASTLSNVLEATSSPFHLLVSCIISLRTKDEVTHAASLRLFAIANNPAQLADLSAATISETIYPAGFYRNKARQLREIARILGREHAGAVPGNEQDLLALPGVGRKTANLVLGLGFGIPAICVDTHVHRISNRLGLVETGTPEATERALQRVLPRDLWIPINELLVIYGQNRCHPISPRCTSCTIDDLCPRQGVTRFR